MGLFKKDPIETPPTGTTDELIARLRQRGQFTIFCWNGYSVRMEFKPANGVEVKINTRDNDSVAGAIQEALNKIDRHINA